MPNKYDMRYREGVASTEREILNSAFDQEEAEDTREENDELVDLMSQSESWDGQPLSDEEQMASMMDDQPEGYEGDRPLEYQREIAGEQRAQQLEQQLAQERAAHQQTLQRFDPELAVERDRQKMAFADSLGVVAVDDALFDQHLANQGRLLQERNAAMLALAETKMQRAAEKYGDQFTDTYNALVARRDDPAVQQIIQRLFHAQEPGEELMNYVGSPLLNRAPPRARTRGPQYAPRSFPREQPMTYADLEAADGGFGGGQDARTERSVFNAIWDDYR
jgi:hypothetical protein